MAYLIIAALTFGLCFALDKGFSRLFRNRKEHKSGRAVKHNKRAALFGLFLAVLGIAGILAGLGGGTGLLILSFAVLLMAAGLLAYYLSFGIYYDEESFLVSTFGKKTVSHRYGEIREQQLYVIQGGSLLVELHMEDGTAVTVQTTMDEALPFLDYAFARWCEQTGRNPDSCDFHNPGSYQWFPPVEVA